MRSDIKFLNLGNTCYVNAVLRLLLGLRAVEEVVVRLEEDSQWRRNNIGDGGKDQSELSKSFIDLVTGHEVNVVAFVKAFVKFSKATRGENVGGLPGDAHEFMNVLTNHLAKEIPQVGRLFGHLVEVKKRCSRVDCGAQSKTTERHDVLTVDNLAEFSHQSVTVANLVERYQRNTFYEELRCDQCKRKGGCWVEHRLKLDRPLFTVMVLWNDDRGSAMKVNCDVHVNPTLRVNEDEVYVARASVKHLGRTMAGGHYVCEAYEMENESRSDSSSRVDDFSSSSSVTIYDDAAMRRSSKTTENGVGSVYIVTYSRTKS